jgi:hypothetical protein
MTTSSPADLAIAFRTLPRRIEQATNDKTPPGAVATADHDVHAAITAAATQLGAAATAEGVGAAIDHRQLSDWTDPELVELQGYANDAARAIRTLENLSETE